MSITIFYAFCLFFWTKHKAGIIAFVAAVLLYTVLPHLIPLGVIHKLLTIAIPFYTIFFTLAVSTFGDNNTRLSGESNFPSHFYTLPVNTSTLVLWPMIFGGCFMFFNCFLINQLWLKPFGIIIDYWWASFITISLMVWLQAIFWRQYRFSGVSIVLVFLIITAFVFIAYYIYYNRDKTFLIVLSLSLQLGIAYYLALKAVSKARKGYTLRPWKWPARFSFSYHRINRTHNSPFQAQCYLENRLHGNILPCMVATMGFFTLVAFLAILFFQEDPQRISRLIFAAPLFVVQTIILIYMLSAGWFTFYSADWYVYNKTQSMAEDIVIPNFVSTLPISNQDLIKAKFISFSKNAAYGFLISVGFSLILLTAVLIVSYPGIALPPFLARIGIVKVISALVVIPVLGLVFTILNSLSNMWLWFFRKTFLWYVIPPIIILVVAKEIWADASWLELFLTYYPWLIATGCISKFIAMGFFLAWLSKNNYYRFDTLVTSVVIWFFFMALCFILTIWICPVKLSNALIWGCLVCITPILGLLGTPVALKYSRTQ